MTKNKLRAHFSSESDEWETPQAFFDDLDDDNHFTLDVAANAENHKCERYYTKEDDGLSQPWDGVVWCNPPYSEVEKWVRKADQECRDNGTRTIMLLPARTDTKWFHDFIYQRYGIEFIRGRLKFSGAKNPAPFPSMLVFFEEVE